jgi:hypothetical protein
MGGYISTTGTPTIEFAASLGGGEVCSTGAKTTGADLAAVNWRLWLDIVCRTDGETGTVVASGMVRVGLDQTYGLAKTTATTIDSTGTLALAVTAEWGTDDPANTITCQTAVVEKLGIMGLS